MKEKQQMRQQATNRRENEKRVSVKLNLRREDSLKMKRAVKALKDRGWRKEEGELRLQELIIDSLFAKADENFYQELTSRLTPLEYLCREGMKNPEVRKEMEKILKKKGKVK